MERYSFHCMMRSYDLCSQFHNDLIFACDHPLCYREFFNTLVYKYQADTHMKINETGIVIALCAVVQARIHKPSTLKYYDPFTPKEFPPVKLQSPELRSALAELVDSVARMRSVAEDENTLVYFKKVPRDTSELPEFPAPTVLNLPSSPYVPPVSAVMMCDIGAKSICCCLFLSICPSHFFILNCCCVSADHSIFVRPFSQAHRIWGIFQDVSSGNWKQSRGARHEISSRN